MMDLQPDYACPVGVELHLPDLRNYNIDKTQAAALAASLSGLVRDGLSQLRDGSFDVTQFSNHCCFEAASLAMYNIFMPDGLSLTDAAYETLIKCAIDAKLLDTLDLMLINNDERAQPLRITCGINGTLLTLTATETYKKLAVMLTPDESQKFCDIMGRGACQDYKLPLKSGSRLYVITNSDNEITLGIAGRNVVTHGGSEEYETLLLFGRWQTRVLIYFLNHSAGPSTAGTSRCRQG